MLKFIEKAKARRKCAANGHDWKPDGTVFDCDGGMGGGRLLYASVCLRCGERAASPFRDAGGDNGTGTPGPGGMG